MAPNFWQMLVVDKYLLFSPFVVCNISKWMIFFDFFDHHEKEISTIKCYVRKKHFTNNSDSLRLARIGLGLNKR